MEGFCRERRSKIMRSENAPSEAENLSGSAAVKNRWWSRQVNDTMNPKMKRFQIVARAGFPSFALAALIVASFLTGCKGIPTKGEKDRKSVV